MSATTTLRNDHRQIRRLEKIVIQCYIKLYAGYNISFFDMEKMVKIMSEFLDEVIKSIDYLEQTSWMKD